MNIYKSLSLLGKTFLVMSSLCLLFLISTSGVEGAALTLPDNSTGFTPLSGTDFKITFPTFSTGGTSILSKTGQILIVATNIARRIVIPIFIVAIVVIGFFLATATNEEKVKKAKNQLLLAVAGMVIVTTANVIVNVVYQSGAGPASQGKAPIWSTASSESLSVLATEVAGILNFAVYVLTIAAVLMIIINGIMMFFAEGNEEEYKKRQGAVILAAVGLFMISMSNVIVKAIYGQDFNALKGGITPAGVKPGPNLSEGLTQAIGIMNFALYFMGAVAVIMVIYAGFMWLTAGGDEEKTKKARQVIIATITGIVVIISSYALVNSFF